MDSGSWDFYFGTKELRKSRIVCWEKLVRVSVKFSGCLQLRSSMGAVNIMYLFGNYLKNDKM